MRALVRSCLALTILSSSAISPAAVFHVTTAGDDLNTGADWASAKATVQGAIDAANESDEIWVAEGVYEEHIVNKTPGGVAVNAALYGGFDGTETTREQRNPVTHVTVLDGTDDGVVLTITGGAGPGTRVDGFTIRNGFDNNGAGIVAIASGPVITNNYFTSNYTEGAGGALLCWGYKVVPPEAQPVITGNSFVYNRATDGGAAIALVGSSPEISQNTIVRNYTSGYGGGIGCWTSESAKTCSPTIANNFIYENAANFVESGLTLGGGGLFMSANGLDGRPVPFAVSAPLIVNNVVAANNAVGGGGIVVIDSEIEAPTITNNTVFANNGAGIYWSGTFPTITNNLVAYNSHGMQQVVIGTTWATLSHNNVYGNSLQGQDTDYVGVTDPTGGSGNISHEPALALYGKGKYWLQPGSPCIDAGDDGAVAGSWGDIDGQSRIQDAHVDIGADEFDGTTWSEPVPIIHVKPGGSDALDGLSWATAKASVSSAIDTAYQVQGDVWVAQGTYLKPSVPLPAPFTLPAWVGLYGGFDGTETSFSQRDPAGHPTVLDGNGEPTVVQSSLGGYLVSAIDGFTIKNGGVYTGGSGAAGLIGIGGGVVINTSSPLVENNIIERNSLGSPYIAGDDAFGAGISLYASFAVIRDNTIRDNEILAPDGLGGGLYSTFSSPVIEGNTFQHNHAHAASAMYFLRSTPHIIGNLVDENAGWMLVPLFNGSTTGAIEFWLCDDFLVERNTISGNVATIGAGITVQSSFAGRIMGNLLIDNSAYDVSAYNGGVGGGIYVEVTTSPLGTIEIVNNTLCGNTATHTIFGERGGGIALSLTDDDIELANNAIAFNSSGIWQNPGTTGYSPTLTSNCLHNGTDNYLNLSPGSSDVIADPEFVDEPGGDYQLAATSPAIDTGTNAPAAFIAIDMAGAPRIQDGDYVGGPVIDVGVYEFSPDFDGDGSVDWQDLDDDDDGALDTADCAPLDPGAWSLPEDVAGLSVIHNPSTVLTWTGQASGTHFDLIGDTMAQLLADDDVSAAACLDDDVAGAPWLDPSAAPGPGTGRYFLIRGQNVCGDGIYGLSSTGGQRTNSSCP